MIVWRAKMATLHNSCLVQRYWKDVNICVIDGTHLVSEEQRMKAYALSVQNYLIGGDVAGQTNLKKFKQAFGGKDLIYADGTSFLDTYDALFSYTNTDKKSLLNLASLNAKPSVKDEIRRIWYWENN